jgi:hypothetical protein
VYEDKKDIRRITAYDGTFSLLILNSAHELGGCFPPTPALTGVRKMAKKKLIDSIKALNPASDVSVLNNMKVLELRDLLSSLYIATLPENPIPIEEQQSYDEICRTVDVEHNQLLVSPIHSFQYVWGTIASMLQLLHRGFDPKV